MKNETDKYWWISPLVAIGTVTVVAALFMHSFGNGKGGITVPIWRAPINVQKRTIDGHDYIANYRGNIIHSESCTNHISTGLQ